MSALKVRSQPSVNKPVQDQKSHVDYLINTTSPAKFNKPKQDSKNKKKRHFNKKKNNGNSKVLSLLKGVQQAKVQYTVSDFPLSEIVQALENSKVHTGFQQASKKDN